MSNNEIFSEFLQETHENLALLDSDLILLETNPGEKSTLAQVFRTLHSIKGTAGFLGFVKLQDVAHSAESLLSRLRSGEMQFKETVATVLLQVVDAIREMLVSIESTGKEGPADYTGLIARVDSLKMTGGAAAPSAPSPAPVFNSPAPVINSAISVLQFASSPQAPSDTLVMPANDEPSTSRSGTSDMATGDGSEVRTSSAADSNIRVDVGLLDKLMNLVGELVLSRNQILQYSDSHEDNGFLAAVQRLDLLISELQAAVMKTRMQPIGSVLNRFPRIVRDQALVCGKKVRLEISGQETELDRTLIEAIRDPLVHMVRNAIDHGIEAPAVRLSRGKQEEGRLRIDAFHEGGKVIVEITDDGGGIDIARLREKALQSELLAPDVIAKMTHTELLRLIFLPGFSTADRVTQTSGRGVGMDVVLTNIERIGGTVDIESTPGKETTIRTKIPLTLAIIPALIVSCGGEQYAVPQVSLLELVRLEPDQAKRGVERMHGVPVYRLRDAMLPLLFLDEQLEIESDRSPDDEVNIVVLQADDRPFGLVVDSIRDTEEIVVKPLQKQIKGIPVFAGAAIMGDGRISLVLDVLGLARRANVISGAKNHAISDLAPSEKEEEVETEPVLLFASCAGGQMAIPLSLVSRLEEFPRGTVESLGSRQVVQYCGGILPLIDVSHELEQLRLRGSGVPAASVASVPARDEVESITVIVYTAGDQQAGLMVGNVLDIIHEHIVARSRANRPGVLFTAVVQERVTEFVDVPLLVRESLFDVIQSTT
ncbi:MAG: chemotaxis protein CheA [Planctomyces sp.]|nr:chemotaxis protein CheA [Planctomyces sp.]